LERRPIEQHFQVFISAVILDRNSQVCFHKAMETLALMQVNHARSRARILSQLYC
jgi:hypothetical protein